MIITVRELLNFVDTTVDYEVLEATLQGLETTIRKRTNNNFQNPNIRFRANTDQIETPYTRWLKIGDTLQVSQSPVNNGLYTIKTIEGEILTLNEPIYSEPNTLFTKIEYPADVRMGVVDIMKWKLKNDDQNYNPEAEKEIQSESISRHSVTYAKDNTEQDIDKEFGVPVKKVAFLKGYMKPRF